MKILQIIFDGYTPSEGNLVNLDGWYGFRRRSMLPDAIPASSKMWAKIYSNKYPDPVYSRHNPELSGRHFFKKAGYNVIENENWMWNKLGSQGINSFNILYYLFTYADHIINQYPDKSQVISMMTNTKKAVWKGIDREISIPRYSVFCEGYDSIHTRVPFIHDFYDKVWRGNNTQKALETLVYMIEEVVFPEVREGMTNNIETYKRLFEFYNNESFVTIPMVESDSMYHFCYPYTEFRNEYKKYFQTLLEFFISKVNPDVVIILGDHEMTSVVNTDIVRSSIRATFNYRGKKHEAIKANWSISPFYMEHTSHASLNIYMKDENLYRTLDRYFSEFCYLKGTIHEILYKFLTEKYKEIGG